MPLKLLLDENLRSGSVWLAIEAHQKRGTYPLDVLRVGDLHAPPLGSDDNEILRWTAAHGRVLVSQDVHTLEDALVRRIASGGVSPGVIILRKGITVHETVELLLLVAYASEASEWQNALKWLP
jgi:hypothetical protein